MSNRLMHNTHFLHQTVLEIAQYGDRLFDMASNVLDLYHNRDAPFDAGLKASKEAYKFAKAVNELIRIQQGSDDETPQEAREIAQHNRSILTQLVNECG